MKHHRLTPFEDTVLSAQLSVLSVVSDLRWLRLFLACLQQAEFEGKVKFSLLYLLCTIVESVWSYVTKEHCLIIFSAGGGRTKVQNSAWLSKWATRIILRC